MSSIGISELNGVKCYNLSAGKTVTEFLEEAKQQNKSLRYNKEYKNRIELIQDFTYPEASSRIRVTNCGQYIGAAGVYPPSFKLFDTAELSMKCERGLNSEIVQFHFLSDDYRKVMFLWQDRTLEFHAQYGKHYTTRIPRYGRDFVYNEYNCEAYIASAESEIYRLSLDKGQFLASFESEVCSEYNVIALNKQLQQVMSVGGVDGIVETWDLRQRTSVAQISVPDEVTALNFDSDGLLMAVGQSSGLLQIYDVRYPNYVYEVQHHYSLPIKSVSFTNNHVLSADAKSFKVSSKSAGDLFTTVEPQADINDFVTFPGSGLILLANECNRMGIWFIPELGPAAKWCSYLENLTEELEEQNVTVYQDYRFLTDEELDKLNARHLIGTEMLKSYMHGYFMELKLYYKLKSLSEPFSYEEYRKEKIREKLEAKRADRIHIRKLRQSNVNKELAEDTKTSQLADDSRFSSLFNDKDFTIDKESEEYKRNNPSYKRSEKRKSLQEASLDPADVVPLKQRLEKKISHSNKPAKRKRVVKEDDKVVRRTIVPAKKMLQDNRHRKY